MKHVPSADAAARHRGPRIRSRIWRSLARIRPFVWIGKRQGALPAGARGGTAAALLVMSVALGAAVWAGALTVDHAAREIYGIPRWGVALTLALVAVILVGGGLLVWARQPAFSAVVLVASAFLVSGGLAIFSFGLLVLLIAGGLLIWAGSGRWSGARGYRAAAGAVLAGAPLPLLLVFATSGPLVDCAVDSVSSGENLFMAIGSAGGSAGESGSATSGSDGIASGRAHGDGYSYSYLCRDGKLARFSLRWR